MGEAYDVHPTVCKGFKIVLHTYFLFFAIAHLEINIFPSSLLHIISLTRDLYREVYYSNGEFASVGAQ